MAVGLSSPLDYVAFVATCAVVVGSVELWLRRVRGSDGLGRGTWVALLLLVVAGGAWVNQAGTAERDRIRDGIRGMAVTYARDLERLGHAQLGPDARPDDPRYLELIEWEKGWLDANPQINDIYTHRLAPDGSVLLWVDSETDYDHDGRIDTGRERRTPIGEPYVDASRTLMAAFEGATTVTPAPYQDRWGTWMSAYAPMHDPQGRLEAVLGVDFDATAWVSAIARARAAGMLEIAVIFAALLATGTVVATLRAELRVRERVSQELADAKALAESASRAKSEFLANMSHEIRTPMTAILGYADLLLEPESTPEERRAFVATILRNGDHLLGVINDVLDISKIESGGMTVESIPTPLWPILDDVLHAWHAKADAKGILLGVQFATSIPDSVCTDPTRLRQVLFNLVGNAIKFTEVGSVELHVAYHEQSSSLAVEVHDTGMGIPLEKLTHLFQPFAQGDGSMARRFGGAGLGLAISRRLAQLLGGDVVVRSSVGEGSTFTLTVCAPPVEGARWVHPRAAEIAA